MDRDEEIGKRVKRYREAAGLSQSDLAAQVAPSLNFTASTVFKIEKAKRKVLASELPIIAGAIGVPAANLLGLGEDREPVLLSGARLEEAMRHLQAAALAYGRAMLSYAESADGIEHLTAADEWYVNNPLIRQTPGWVASADVLRSLEATLKLNRVKPQGDLAKTVLSKLRAEHEHFHGKRDG